MTGSFVYIHSFLRKTESSSRLRALFNDLTQRLSCDPPDLPSWLHVLPETIPTVLHILDFWLKSNKSTRRTMSGHAHRNVRSNSMLGMMPGLDKDFQQRVDDYSARERDCDYGMRNIRAARCIRAHI